MLIWSYMYQCIIISISKYFKRQRIERKTGRRKKLFWQTYSKFTIIAMYTEEEKYKEEDKVPACQLWEAKVEQGSPFWEALQCKCQGQYWRKHSAPPDPLPPSLCVNLDSVPLSHSLSGTEADAFMSKEGRTATFGLQNLPSIHVPAYASSLDNMHGPSVICIKFIGDIPPYIDLKNLHPPEHFILIHWYNYLCSCQHTDWNQSIRQPGQVRESNCTDTYGLKMKYKEYQLVQRGHPNTHEWVLESSG